MENIYLLYSCDGWRIHNTMELIMASTNEEKIKKEIKNQVINKHMGYKGNIDDLDDRELTYINDYLKCGYIEIVVDGEKQ